MRFMLGITQSACEPAMYSLVSDYFPTKMRSTAISVLTAGSYIGAAASSLCIMATAQYGWRGCYKLMGAFGILAGALNLLLVREPKRDAFKEYEAAESGIKTPEPEKEE